MRRELIIALLLVASTLSIYGQAVGFDFVNWDDPHYVTQSELVRAGWNRQSVVWAFTSFDGANWFPLTRLSWMLDAELFGLDAAGHHATSILLHVLDVLLLFWVLRSMTGAVWRSALVAALFALHPLHVESVAWISGRKDVLCTFFGLLAMRAYVAYARRGGARWYSLTAVFLALGLMAKPMLVTLPFVFLLLDIWPLDRIRSGGAPTAPPCARPAPRRRSLARVVAEKLPLLALSLACAVVTFLAQSGGRMVLKTATIPIGLRLQNALVTYVRYVYKTVWPLDLSVWYTHPNLEGGTPWAWWQVAGAGALLALVSTAVFRSSRRYLWLGWLWYLGTLVPVIGLVQVGGQAMADRYTYVPLIGLFVIAAWGGADLARLLRARSQRLGQALPLFAAVALAALSILSWHQVQFWRDSFTLNRRALRLAPSDPVVHYQLGRAFHEAGKLDEAIAHYGEALELKPDLGAVHPALGIALAQQGDFDDAFVHFQTALKSDPDDPGVHQNLANVYLARGDPERAMQHLRLALQLQPDQVEAIVSMGMALAQEGELDRAIDQFRKALQLKPDLGQAHLWLGMALETQGEVEEGRKHLEAARRLGFRPPRSKGPTQSTK